MPKLLWVENAVDSGILHSDYNNSIKDEVQPQGSRPVSELAAEHQEAPQTGTYEGGEGWWQCWAQDAKSYCCLKWLQETNWAIMCFSFH